MLMKPIEYYSKIGAPYPRKRDFTALYAYDSGKVVWSGPHSEHSAVDIRRKFPNALIQQVTDEEGYKKAAAAHNAERQRLHEEFKNDLFESYGVGDHLKRHRCFDIAWDLGHSSGYSEVLNYFDVLVELIQD
jgi:hypothetical protein